MTRASYGFWTIERCHERAKLYENRTAFRKNDFAAYQAAKDKSFLAEICGHMRYIRVPKRKLDFSSCKELAAQFKTRTEFARGDRRAYSVAWENGWLDDICSHMSRVGDINSRQIYEIANHSDKIVYIGLSHNPNKRFKNHLRESNYIFNEIGKTYEFNVISDLLPNEEAAKREGLFVTHYILRGYKILNRKSTGSLGAPRQVIWTYEKCQETAKSFNHIIDFKNAFPGAYNVCRKNGWTRVFFPKREVRDGGADVQRYIRDQGFTG